MLKNYLLIALRNLRRNKVFSFINILGLALGMACSLLILLWVKDEKSVDAFHKDSDRIYSIYERQYYDNKIDAFHSTPGIMAEEMKRVFPEVEFSTQFAWNNKCTFEANGKIIKEEGNNAGADFFKIFSYPLLEGKPATALSTPLSIAISRKMANDLFGSPAAAIGKTVRYQNDKDLKVDAVFENLPALSSVKFEFLTNWQLFLEENQWAKEWGNNGPATYLKLRKDANATAFEKKIVLFLDNYNKEQDAGFRIELGLQRFADMYLHSNFKEGKLSGGRIEYVSLFSIVAIFILLIACINFMNLTTARSLKRAKEIGVRKVVGAYRATLVKQFIGEAVLLAFLSLMFAFIIVVLLLPLFNRVTGKEINFPFSSLGFWLRILLLTLLTGVVSGSYPALFISSFNPIKVLKGTLRFSAYSGYFRKGLVVFQFTLSIILIIATIIVSKQVKYIQTKNLGYNRENLLYLPLEGELPGKFEVLKQEALKINGVKQVSRISQTPTQIENGTGGVSWDGKDENTRPMFTQAAIGYDFAKTMGIEVVKGRDYSKDFATDSSGYILNEQALAKIGYKDPVGKPLTFWEKKGTIIGVYKDFHFNSLRVPVNALVLRLGETDGYGQMLVRTEAGKTKQALAGLEKLCRQLNPKFPFTYQFSDEEYTRLYKSEQTTGKLADSFAFLAIFISCLGLLGLAIFTAEQKTKEFGIRKVLGASVHSLFTLLSKEFMQLVFISLVVAIPVAWWFMNSWLKNYAYRTPVGWWVFALAGLAAMSIALLTVSFQAAKAAVVNPIKSLRTE